MGGCDEVVIEWCGVLGFVSFDALSVPFWARGRGGGGEGGKRGKGGGGEEH